MIQNNSRNLEEMLMKSFGINLKVKEINDVLSIRFSDLEFGEGFQILIKHEWRHLSAEFIPDSFAALLLQSMNNISNAKKSTFVSLWMKYYEEYNEAIVEINGEKSSLINEDIFKKEWYGLKIKFNKAPIYLEELSTEDFNNEVFNICKDIVSFLLLLLPIEETLIEDTSELGMPEGAATKVKVNRYERSHLNRQICLSYKGYNCHVCGFNFEHIYGELGKNYIHVHHITPISQLGPNYHISPIHDLIPLCPNCHVMIHQRNPPFTIKELKEILNENKN